MNAELTSSWAPDSDLLLRAQRLAALGDPSRLAIVEALMISDRSPSELGAEFGIASNRLAHHLDTLEQAGIVTRTPSEGDGRRRYVRLEFDSVIGLVWHPRMRASSVLFVCRHNSARSQYAAAYWNRNSPIRASSAGSEPAARVHPLAIEAAAVRGVDLSAQRPRGYGEVERDPDLLITVCDIAFEDAPPFQPDRQLHWSVADPARSDDPAVFDAAFAEIEARIDRLAGSILPSAVQP